MPADSCGTNLAIALFLSSAPQAFN